jgi:hypothetical protein
MSATETSEMNPFPFPDDISAKDAGIDITQGPDFASTHDPSAMFDKDDLLKLPEAVEAEIDSFINERMVSPKELETHKDSISSFYTNIVNAFRFASKQYLTADYIVNYKAPSFVSEQMKDVPAPGKKIIKDNSVLMLLFLEPKFLMMLFVCFIL